MKKPFKTISTTAMAAVFAASVIVPVASAATSDESVKAYKINKVIIEEGGQLVAVDYQTYMLNLPFLNEEAKNGVKYVEFGNGLKVSALNYLLELGAQGNDDEATYRELVKEEKTEDLKDVLEGEINADGDIVVGDVEVPDEGELTVESVTAINPITVAFGTAVEDLELPATVTATLNDEEATVVELDVEWAESEDFNANAAGTYTFTGTVTVADVDAEYTISEEVAAVSVSVIVEAPTQAVIDAAIAAVNLGTNDAAAVLVALQNPVLGLTDVVEANAAAYLAEVANSVNNTIARIQQTVKRVNADEAADEQELIDDVNEALTFADLRLALAALEPTINLASGTTFNQLYFDAIDSNTTETKEQILAAINAVNVEQITALVVKAETDLSQTAYNAADALVGQDLLEEAVQTDLEDRLAAVQTKIDVAAAIVLVNAATDEDELETALEDLDLDLKNLDMVNNKTAYFTAFGLLTDDFTTVPEIQAFVDSVNTDESDSLITTAIGLVNAASDEDELETALEDLDLDLENLDMVNNKTAYFTAFGLLTIPGADDFTTVPEIQAFVDAVNLAEAIDAVDTQVGASVTAATLLTALQSTVLDLGKVVTRNQEVYASELEALFDADNTFEFKTVADIQAFVNAANATPVGLVNTAKNTTESRTALESTELDLDLAVYNELSSLQKNLVAQAIRANATNFTDADSVQAELDSTILGL